MRRLPSSIRPFSASHRGLSGRSNMKATRGRAGMIYKGKRIDTTIARCIWPTNLDAQWYSIRRKINYILERCIRLLLTSIPPEYPSILPMCQMSIISSYESNSNSNTQRQRFTIQDAAKASRRQSPDNLKKLKKTHHQSRAWTLRTNLSHYAGHVLNKHALVAE